MYHNSVHNLMRSYHLVEEMQLRANIDPSHNHIHSKEVIFWAKEIMHNLSEPIPLTTRIRAGHCAILHDLLDRKYSMDLSVPVRHHLVGMFGETETQNLMMVMEDMSYSKTVMPNGTVTFPSWLDQDQELKMTFHIVREADLLSAYNLARMVYYRKSNFPEMTDDEIRQDIRALFEKRMDMMITNKLFYFPTTYPLADSLQDMTRIRMRSLHQLDLEKELGFLELVDLKNYPMERLLSEFVMMR